MYLEFEKYLQSLNISFKSIKNYKSDISHFTQWATLKLKSIGTYVESIIEVSPFLNQSLANEYLNYMVDNKFPKKTINRRLSTLRHLSKYLIASQIIDFDFMENIKNIATVVEVKKLPLSNHPSVSEFHSFLEAEKVSKNTIKNYLSDIRQFLTWLETQNHAHSS